MAWAQVNSWSCASPATIRSRSSGWASNHARGTVTRTPPGPGTVRTARAPGVRRFVHQPPSWPSLLPPAPACLPEGARGAAARQRDQAAGWVIPVRPATWLQEALAASRRAASRRGAPTDSDLSDHLAAGQPAGEDDPLEQAGVVVMLHTSTGRS